MKLSDLIATKTLNMTVVDFNCYLNIYTNELQRTIFSVNLQTTTVHIQISFFFEFRSHYVHTRGMLTHRTALTNEFHSNCADFS